MESLIVVHTEQTDGEERVGRGQRIQALERVRVRDAQIVAGQDAHAGATGERIDQVVLEQLEARGLHERSDDVYFTGHAQCLLQNRQQPALDVLPGDKPSQAGEGVLASRWGIWIVLLQRGDDATNTAARVIDIAVEARDDVNMQVHDRLPRSGTSIESDVVAVRAQLRVELFPHRGDGSPELSLLVRRGVEPGRGMAARQDQRVPR
jgi:hypothetical protein